MWGWCVAAEAGSATAPGIAMDPVTIPAPTHSRPASCLMRSRPPLVRTTRSYGALLYRTTTHRDLLQFLDALRPVVLQQARQRPIGEQPSPGLTARAVVALVLGVDDALHGGAA